MSHFAALIQLVVICAPTVPVLLSTAHGMRLHMLKCQELAVSRYILMDPLRVHSVHAATNQHYSCEEGKHQQNTAANSLTFIVCLSVCNGATPYMSSKCPLLGLSTLTERADCLNKHKMGAAAIVATSQFALAARELKIGDDSQK